MDKKVIIHNQAVIDGLTKDTDNVEYVNNSLHYKPMVLKNTYTFDELQVISKFFDDWLRDAYIRGGDVVETFGYGGLKSEKENKMTNHDKFIEIFGETNGKVKASESWLDAEYTGPVRMTEREKFIEWLDEQPLVRYEEYDSTGDAIYIYGTNDDQPLLRVSGFDKVPGKVYVRIDGLCGDKPISYVKDIVRNASNKGIDKVFGLDGLYDSIFRR